MSKEVQNDEDVKSALRQIFGEDISPEKIKNYAFQYAELMAYYRCALMEVETKFNVLDEEFSLQFDRNPIESIKGRIKRPESIHKKLLKYGLDISIDNIKNNINDIAGIRVVCSFLDDVYVLADALLKQDDITLIEKKDYIQHPKENGYRSLHLIVAVPIFLAHEKRMMNVEIQLRTIAMDFWASLEHQLRYKKDFVYTDEMLRELKECAETSSELDVKMENIRRTVRSSLDIYNRTHV
ncbi:MAG: GTP pyrophosphokinase family protein [Oscillospiraceae bacterium]